MTMTLDNDAGIDAAGMTSGELMNELAELLAQQGFEVRRPASDDDGRLTITNAPKGRCEIDVYDSGCVICDYFPWASERAYPVDIIRAVLRLLAVPQDDSAGGHVDPPSEIITLKGVVGCAMRARGLAVELQTSADQTEFSVFAEVVIANPEQPGRGTVRITDEGNIWWECYVDELTGHAREIVMALTDMLVPPVTHTGMVT